MIRTSVILATTTAFAALAGMASAQECGDLTIASMNWQSAELAAAVDQFILNNGYGCNAEIIQGDTVPTITSMVEKGDPQIAPPTDARITSALAWMRARLATPIRAAIACSSASESATMWHIFMRPNGARMSST